MTFTFKTDLQLLHVTGEKAATLLQGQLTNDIKSLAENTGNYNLLLNLKGKVMADAHVLRTATGFVILASARSLLLLKTHLEKLAPLSKVSLNLAFTPVHHIFERTVPEIAEGALAPLPPIGTLCFRSDRFGLPGLDVLENFTPPAGARELTTDEIEVIRIEHGIPKIGIDVTEAHLPQEARLDHALNFKKGCYLGQEIIARLHYKGHVNKILSGLVLEDTAVPSSGTPVFVGEKIVGEITSAVLSAKLKAPLALAYLPAHGDLEKGPFVVGEKKIPARRVELPIT